MKKAAILFVVITVAIWLLPRLSRSYDRHAALIGASQRTSAFLHSLQAGNGKASSDTQAAICLWWDGGRIPEGNFERVMDAFEMWKKKGHLPDDFETIDSVYAYYESEEFPSPIIVKVSLDGRDLLMKVPYREQMTWYHPPGDQDPSEVPENQR